METVQLRRYVFEPGRLPDFLTWFPALVPVREQFGFRIVFALADAEHETFTWAVAHDGDEDTFRTAEAACAASPERARAELGFAAQVSFAEGMREFASAPLRGGGA